YTVPTLHVDGGKVVYKSGTLNVTDLQINGTAQMQVAANGARTLAVSSLAVADGAKLDLTDNNLIVHSTHANQPGDTSAIAALAKKGLNATGALWTGNGITSSTAAANAALHSNSTFFALGVISNDGEQVGLPPGTPLRPS